MYALEMSQFRVQALETRCLGFILASFPTSYLDMVILGTILVSIKKE